MPRSAVFLDRDDTLMEARSLPAPAPPAAPGDVCDPALVRLLPGVLGACRRLNEAGFALVVISNQGVVARGGATIERVGEVNDRLRALLADGRGGSLIDAVYVCPYHPRGTVAPFAREHPWRKPAPGMILAAAEDLALDLRSSWLVGDAERDIEAGVAAGIPRARCLRIGPHEKLSGLPAAADVILAAGAGAVEE
ncbi:MAG: HAD-IIIA family hydrolase [Phycisphaerales bacterium]